MIILVRDKLGNMLPPINKIDDVQIQHGYVNLFRFNGEKDPEGKPLLVCCASFHEPCSVTASKDSQGEQQ